MKLRPPPVKPRTISVAGLRRAIDAGHASTKAICDELDVPRGQLELVLAYHLRAGRMRCSGGRWSFVSQDREG